MRKRKSRIPIFKSYEEEANFWDTHNITDFEDETEDVEIIFDLDRPKEETLIVRLQKNLKDKMEKLAKRRGISLSTLARILLTERLQTVNR
ncbi:ribbon-helix-helix protein, CopG family [Candidatus Gottesmanbacteria bacterium]|nr:ribbon-helix-helix protein, CopG family [Candidatus Gottesmanbacteria bacterium]